MIYFHFIFLKVNILFSKSDVVQTAMLLKILNDTLFIVLNILFYYDVYIILMCWMLSKTFDVECIKSEVLK